MTFIKRCVLCLLIAVVAVSSVQPFDICAANVWDSDFLEQEESEPEQSTTEETAFEKIAEKGGRALFADKKSGCFYVEDTTLGNRWYSNPQNVTDDDASGLYLMEAKSLFLISIYDEEASMISKGNSEALGVRGGKVDFKKNSSGYTVTYTLESISVTIPVSITLTDKGIRAEVSVKDIKEDGNLISVSLLPYLNAGSKTDNGYLVLPDGSGSIMYFNNGHTTADEYAVPMYGKDISSASVMKPQDTYDAKLPIYGVKNGASSLLAVLDDGAAQAKIHALTNGKYTSYANVYSEFFLRGSDTVVLGETAGNPQSYQMYQDEDIDIEKISMDIFLLSGDDVDYNTMAAQYRGYIAEKYGMTEVKTDKSRIYLDFYGAVKKKKIFLGIPFTVNHILSEIDAIGDIVEDLGKEDVVGIQVVLKEWSKAQLSQKVDKKASPISGVGSVKEMKALNALLGKQNGALYPQFEIQRAAKSGNGVSVFGDSIRNISNMPAGVYTFKENTLIKDNKIAKKYFIKVSASDKQLKKITKDLTKKGFETLAFSSLDVYSDYDKEFTSRSIVVSKTEKMISKYLSGKTVSIGFPADYTFSAVKTATNVPFSSNGYAMTDHSIPFYQLAVSGLVECTGTEINLSADPKEALLGCLETGSALHYAFMTEDNSIVTDTELDWLYSADYSIWKENIVESFAAMEKLQKMVGTSRMVSHKTLSKDVYVTAYENGACVYINYGETPYEVDGSVIEPCGYKFRDLNGEWI